MGFAGAWGDFGFISSTCFLIFGRQQRANADSHRADFMDRIWALHFVTPHAKIQELGQNLLKISLNYRSTLRGQFLGFGRWVCSCALFIDITITIYPSLVTAV